MGASLAATLVAFFAIGFFAATLLSLFRFLMLVLSAALAVIVVALLEGLPLIRSLEVGCGGFALSQVGFGLGLVWMAAIGSRCVPD